jgi:hypothetical protein
MDNNSGDNSNNHNSSTAEISICGFGDHAN